MKKRIIVGFLILSSLCLFFKANNVHAIDPVIDPIIEIPKQLPSIDPDDIVIDPIIPIDPCLLSDLVINFDKNDASISALTSNSVSYSRNFGLPFLISGNDAGFMKIEYDRVTVNNSNGTDGIQFVTANDTFFFDNAGLTVFGKRRNTTYGIYSGSGVVIKIIDNSNNNVIEADVSYVFDNENERVCFFIK